MIPDLYGLLGVSPVASAQELRVAFLRVAKATHPDVTIGLSNFEREAAERRFREAQRAYEILSDLDRRSLYDELLLAGFESDEQDGTPPTGPTTPSSQAGSRDTSSTDREPPRADVVSCEICGATPAAPIVLKRNVGLFVARRSYTLDAVLCRSCAQAASRNFQIESLTKGWFGVVSVPVNLWNIAANSARSSAHRERTRGGSTIGAPDVAPGWYPDPAGRHALRYFNAAGNWERLCKDESGREVRDLESSLWAFGPPGSPPPTPPPPRSEAPPGAGRNGAGWYPDPSGRFSLRYFNAGGNWERLCRTADGREVRDMDTDPNRWTPPTAAEG